MSETTGLRMTEERVDRLQRNLAGAGHLYSTERALRDGLHDHELLLRVATAATRQRKAQDTYHAAMNGKMQWEHGMEAALLFAETDLDAALRACGLLSEEVTRE
jgi:hypothetical protein